MAYAEKKRQEALAREKQLGSSPPEFAQRPGYALSEQEKLVLEERGTEAPHSGEYDKFQPSQGYFACRKCGQPIYSYAAKFESGCGWPAFDMCYSGSIKTSLEDDGRVEISCSQCSGHFGHVFNCETHSKSRTEQRHCANSLALRYICAAPPSDVKEARVVVPAAAEMSPSAAPTPAKAGATPAYGKYSAPPTPAGGSAEPKYAKYSAAAHGSLWPATEGETRNFSRGSGGEVWEKQQHATRRGRCTSANIAAAACKSK
eukprot:gnl/TRDRNA2_/TRDRNA2_81188_c0_seq2.p1 gnl/TRDRNA2_/TRDRNA2_81188_c0~~gnl/TRDRNA2_/TRDRNA2_81188_c0_seq2.p1  ORF type:complete len:259 (-),score=44.52 gnl/TRDRNA2_/TRDRNA2_81188_c0_seq2:436-1212(-)